jgi:hypothetical protein
MGSGGTHWENDDLIDYPRMNQKTVYVGPTEPAVMYAGMHWHDTTDDILKIRNKDNNAWTIQLNQPLLIASSPTFAQVTLGANQQLICKPQQKIMWIT